MRTGENSASNHIVLLDTNDADSRLAALVLGERFPSSLVTICSDLLDALHIDFLSVDVVVTNANVEGATASELINHLRDNNPHIGIVLFANQNDLTRALSEPGLAVDGLVRKSSAGYYALPDMLTRLLRNDRNTNSATQPEPNDHGSGENNTPTEIDAPNTQSASVPAHGELRDMAAILSHDLREPLQQIERLLEPLLGRPHGTTVLNSQRTLEQASDCARKANQLLDATLGYLAMTARAVEFSQVSLDECLDNALEVLRPDIESSDARIQRAPLPVVHGDATHYTRIFQNLLSNALKFRGQSAPQIAITSGTNNNLPYVKIVDNGIGIPEEFLDRIFEMGQRLHTHEEYPGSGVGLALCRRIMNNLGGDIRAETNNGPGSTFIVELPRPLPQVKQLSTAP